jgi:hypothetical protein
VAASPSSQSSDTASQAGSNGQSLSLHSASPQQSAQTQHPAASAAAQTTTKSSAASA